MKIGNYSFLIRGTELAGDETYNSLDIKNLFNLVVQDMNLEEQMENYLVSVYLLKILQQINYFPTRSPGTSSLTEEEVFIGMLLSHFLQVVKCNSHQICHVTPEHFQHKTLLDILKSNFQPTSIGCGINATLSFFNHCCDPNTLKIQKVLLELEF